MYVYNFNLYVFLRASREKNVFLRASREKKKKSPNLTSSCPTMINCFSSTIAVAGKW